MSGGVYPLTRERFQKGLLAARIICDMMQVSAYVVQGHIDLTNASCRLGQSEWIPKRKQIKAAEVRAYHNFGDLVGNSSTGLKIGRGQGDLPLGSAKLGAVIVSTAIPGKAQLSLLLSLFTLGSYNHMECLPIGYTSFHNTQSTAARYISRWPGHRIVSEDNGVVSYKKEVESLDDPSKTYFVEARYDPTVRAGDAIMELECDSPNILLSYYLAAAYGHQSNLSDTFNVPYSEAKNLALVVKET